MSILQYRTGEDEGQFHISRELSEAEEAALNAISEDWGYDGEEGEQWINGPLDAALLPAFAAFLEGLAE